LAQAKKYKTLSKKIVKARVKAGSVAQMEKHLTSKHKALSSNPTIIKNTK
jgi:hypothetical protein